MLEHRWLNQLRRLQQLLRLLVVGQQLIEHSRLDSTKQSHRAVDWLVIVVAENRVVELLIEGAVVVAVVQLESKVEENNHSSEELSEEMNHLCCF